MPNKSSIAKCSFCSRPRNEVKALISGPGEAGPYICNRCIDQACKAFISEQKKEQAAKENEQPLKKPVEIKAFLDERVIAQDKAKIDLSIAIYNHYRRREAIRQGVDLGDSIEIEKSNVLVMGPSGTGKTLLARALAKMLDVPFYVGDATKLTASGYVGDDVESMLQGLLQEANGAMERAQWGIVLIDEFDKIARKSGRGATGFRDVGGEMVQQAILKLLEGSKVSVPRGQGRSGMGNEQDMMDTTNVLFICCGSFAGIEDVINRRVNKSAKLGFGSSDRVKLSGSETYLAVTEEDVLEFGLIPEVMGRLPVLTTTIDLTEHEMVRILTEPKNAIIKQFKALFGLDSIDLQFDDEALMAIGREAKTRPTGARALRSIVEQVMQPYSFESRSRTDIKAIRITADVVDKKAPAIIMTKEPATEQHG